MVPKETRMETLSFVHKRVFERKKYFYNSLLQTQKNNIFIFP